ncbi:DUF2380 domain-containing protein [Glaciimonas immobilis]|uniref:DUF2380 domain-containing protein n=1 Tax=Glaciimonas immobilis TaxID=728004 RepID=A0A840RWD7_9BURK|nr:DUF2380 domain-containing protein [Glaciimonas immobilis]MBB5202195.1 hypothetical protein [Glaciimonas immobilis]
MNSVYSFLRYALIVMLLGPLPAFNASAADMSIAVLDFELNDLTLNLTANPVNPDEVERTSQIKSLLQQALLARGGYKIVEVAPKSQDQANGAFGYIYDHHDVAADLGRSVGADWIVVGRVHKGSFLFVYLKAQLINTKTKQVVGLYSVEVKGQQKKLTPKGVDHLAEQINDTIRHTPNVAPAEK